LLDVSAAAPDRILTLYQVKQSAVVKLIGARTSFITGDSAGKADLAAEDSLEE
jgi:hypothetical protein